MLIFLYVFIRSKYQLKPVNEEKFAQVFARAVEQIAANRENPQKGRVLLFHS